MADTPFGASFGNPAKYMGSSGIGEALKTGLTAYGLQQSGLVDWLNKQGLSKNDSGKWNYKVPEGSVPPIGATGADMDIFTAGGPAVPPSTSMQPAIPNTTTPAMTAPAAQTVTPPQDIGSKILDNDWHGADASPQAQRDFNPYVPQTGYNTMLASGNEYQQTPGYGKLAKAMQAFGGGMMG